MTVPAPSEVRARARELGETLPLFREFTAGEREAVLDLVEPMEFDAGTLLVEQDTPGDCMFVVLQGVVTVRRQIGERSVHLARLGPGEFFGEIALVDEGPRSADVVAETPCLLLRVDQGVLRAMAGVYPAAAFKLLVAVGRVLIARARAANARYLDSLCWGGMLGEGRAEC